ncbi:MAG: phage tail protein [Candidatus Latescibacterota bacterium]
MRYAVDILDDSRNRVAELSGLVSARFREKINTPALITVETVECTEWEYIVPGKSFLRLRTIPDGAQSTFRVMEVKEARIRERTSLTATARHIIADAANEIFSDAADLINLTPGELAERALDYSEFGIGTVEPAGTIPFVRFEFEPVLDCLLRICSITGGEIELDEASGNINIMNQIGESNGVIFRYGVNLKGASRTVSISRLANRVYGFGGGNPPLLLDGATSSGGSKYAEDTDSQSLYGLHEAACSEPTLEDTENLVVTPAFDGVYTGGLCENWVNMSAAVEKNTDPAYCLYGAVSQKVTGSASGQGIKQDVAVTSGKVYSLLAYVILASGSVRVEVDDGTAVYRRPNAVTGTGLAVIRIENWKALNSSVTVKIMQEGGGIAEFYVDSVQIAEGASTKPFTIGKSADTLWNRTVEYLEARKDPQITYEVDLVDLYGDIRAEREADRFGLGDEVTVTDPTIGIEITTRVMDREVDILHPWRVKVHLDSSSSTLADILDALRKSQEEGVKHTRAALAESSTAAETGSSRLGFMNQAFRFFGAVTASSWNSVSWSAGTLRVGDGYFSITSGSAAGLTGSSTFYFYFDRTSPSTFGYTTSAALAEGEDRILVFAVTTTTSPTLCVIHPLGIIKG